MRCTNFNPCWRTRGDQLNGISGTLETLLGGDLFDGQLLPGLDAPAATLGGTGTFDAVFNRDVRCPVRGEATDV
jgi:uncharacterized membrane protein